MSMISPELYIERECKGKSYRELVKIRDEILASVQEFEKGNVSPEEWDIYPSPGTRYHFDLQCLVEVMKLVEETYMSEVLWGGDDEGAFNKEKEYAIVSRLLETLKTKEEGYDTSTFRLLEEVGFDAEKFSDDDLMSINSLLFREAPREGLILDMSAHEGRLEGLPYVLDFTLLKSISRKQGLLVTMTFTPERSPWEKTVIDVFDRPENNAIVHAESIKAIGQEDLIYTLDGYAIGKIKDILADPLLRMGQEDDGYVQESGIIIDDGVDLDIDLFFQDGCDHFFYTNLNAYKNYLDKYPQTAKVYEIYEIIKREIDKRIMDD